MKIYTKTGDQGQTGLVGGDRVYKDHLRITAYGTIDELNAQLGLAIAHAETLSVNQRPDELVQQWKKIQNELFFLGSELATPSYKKTTTKTIGFEAIEFLERSIDQFESNIKPLKNFILPGGSILSAQLHVVRTVSRRAERECIRLHHQEPLRVEVIQYVNRLSDYFFVCARYVNHLLNVQDVIWQASLHINY